MRGLFRHIMLVMALVHHISAGADPHGNYIKAFSYLDPTGNDASARVTATYFDGLGRERQRVEIASGGNGENIVWRTDYDRRGNPGRKWLPVATDAIVAGDGEFLAAIKEMYGDDEIPYTSYGYDLTGMNRLKEETGPGRFWQKHGKKVTWHKNTPTGQYSCVMLIARKDGSVQAKGKYPVYSLSVTETSGADGLRTLRFDNRTGKTVMERVIGPDGETADTRFVYDVRGDLRCVISPEGSKLLPEQGDVDNSILDDYGQRYDYDLWHRCVMSKAPGCGSVEYVYNKMGAVCFESTAAQRRSGTWTVIKYDRHRRQAVKGTASMPGATRASLQRQYGDSLMQERFIADLNTAESTLQYTNDCGPADFEPYMAWYYDDYEFIYFGNEAIKSRLTATVSEGYTQKNNLTGTAMRLNGNGGVWVTATRYDHRGLPTHRYLWDLYLQSYRHSVLNTYDFAGNLTQSEESIEEMTEQTVISRHTAITRTDYDHYGRALKTTLRIDNKPEQTIATYAYDALGRLSLETGAVTTGYDYDIRSNLIDIHSEHFRQRSVYEMVPENDIPVSHTGINALTTAWFDGQDAAGSYVKSERFSYNGLGHYKSSVCDNGEISEEIVTDLDANVLEIKRKYNGDVVQDAVLQYDGGKNTAVSDCSSPYWSDHVGRFPAGDYEIRYDISGRITADATRDIESVIYHPFANLPYRISMGDGNYTVRNHFPDGTLLSSTRTARTIQTITSITSSGDTIIRQRPWTQSMTSHYIGNFECRGGDNYFYITPQGHYDLKKGQHFWFQRDRLGSTVAVYDSVGNILQTTAYYPSGTPHQLQFSAIATKFDDQTDRLHIGNRWLSLSGINLYDNTARLHDPLLMHYGAPDPLFFKFPGYSPWSHCGGDPVNNVDLFGMDIYNVKGEVLKDTTGVDIVVITKDSNKNNIQKILEKNKSIPLPSQEVLSSMKEMMELTKKKKKETKGKDRTEYGLSVYEDGTISKIEIGEQGSVSVRQGYITDGGEPIDKSYDIHTHPANGTKPLEPSTDDRKSLGTSGVGVILTDYKNQSIVFYDKEKKITMKFNTFLNTFTEISKGKKKL